MFNNKEIEEGAQEIDNTIEPPIVPEINEYTKIPMSILKGTKLYDIITYIQKKVNTPSELILIDILTKISTVTQHRFDVKLPFGGESTAPISLYGMIIARSGERKSTVGKILSEPIHEFEKIQQQEYKELLLKCKGNIDMKPPIFPGIISSLFTIEGIKKLLREGVGYCGIIDYEGGGILAGGAMNKDNRMKTMTNLSKVWDGNPVQFTYATKDLDILYNKRISMLLAMQPGVARKHLFNKDIEDQGLLSRCLIIHAESLIGSRFIAIDIPDNVQNGGNMEYYNNWISAQLQANKEWTEPKQRILTYSKDGCRLLIEFHNNIEFKMNAGEYFAENTDLVNKSVENAVRLAACISLFEHPNSDIIEDKYITIAIDIIEHIINPYKYIIDHDSEPNIMELLKWMLNDSGKKRFINGSIKIPDLARYAPKKIRSTPLLRTMAQGLYDNNWGLYNNNEFHIKQEVVERYNSFGNCNNAFDKLIKYYQSLNE